MTDATDLAARAAALLDERAPVPAHAHHAAAALEAGDEQTAARWLERAERIVARRNARTG